MRYGIYKANIFKGVYIMHVYFIDVVKTYISMIAHASDIVLPVCFLIVL